MLKSSDSACGSRAVKVWSLRKNDCGGEKVAPISSMRAEYKN